MILALIVVLLILFIVGEFLTRQFVKEEEEHYYRFDPVNKLYRRKPYLEGPWQKRNIKGYFKLNNEGWNSTRDYFKQKEQDTFRIACIGTSETGCYQVHVNDAWPKILENRLNEQGHKCEVYTFAADRSYGFAHALHVCRYVVNNFNPDLIIYNGNFVEETIYGTTEKRHYMLLDIDDHGKVKEMSPVNDRLPVLGEGISLKSLFFQSKFIKFLRPKLAIRTRLKKAIMLVRRFSGQKQVQSKVIKKPIKTEGLSFAKKTEIAVHYCLEELKKIQDQKGVKMIFGVQVLRGKGFNWNNIMEESQKTHKEFGQANKKAILEQYGFPYFDLTQEFEDDYKINNKKFDYLLDPHPNQQGNKVEGEAIARVLINKGFIN